MTNEQRDKTIAQIERIQKNLGSIGETPDYLDFAIEALEQQPCEDVLDKIRAEIEDIAFDSQEIDGEHENLMIVILNDALDIIDKYKAESDKEGDNK